MTVRGRMINICIVLDSIRGDSDMNEGGVTGFGLYHHVHSTLHSLNGVLLSFFQLSHCIMHYCHGVLLSSFCLLHSQSSLLLCHFCLFAMDFFAKEPPDSRKGDGLYSRE